MNGSCVKLKRFLAAVLVVMLLPMAGMPALAETVLAVFTSSAAVYADAGLSQPLATLRGGVPTNGTAAPVPRIDTSVDLAAEDGIEEAT